ncbi:MBL fold metallo-hydrolase [Falsirhodobacter algicola]|uniref:MBL fold metallo-hydrolase n=1 Tax=Falsirhodobacter algicola TaxID=2692330 RepID=A0A8J8MQX2_9RHOB|nr:MBL fold metallo-hydrolase [Falsirhodobacter algicola]QUS34804.1 MBL fold metallo-hydrolase [Falsirhodobacter algicola]
MTITRRTALTAGAALPLAGLIPAGVQAQTTPEEPTMTLFHTIPFGAMTLTVLKAGTAVQSPAHEIFGLNASDEEFEEVSAANFIPSDRALGNFSPVVVQTGDEAILFDTGLSPDGTLAALTQAGMSAGDITKVVITHMHGDHIGGLSDGSTLTFPNAELITGRVEMEAWLASGGEAFDAKVRPFSDDFRLIEGGDEVAPGITAKELFGHTPGMMGFMLRNDADQSLMLAVDFANHYVWSLGRPDWEVRFDMDKAGAIDTRQRVLAMLAEEKMPFIGYHMPFPSVGYVAKDDEGYRFVPESYQFELATR